MDGLTCEHHGTFALCHRCGAAQKPEHRCLADEPGITLKVPKPKSKLASQKKTLKANCVICNCKILRGLFCSKHKKYLKHYYSNRKKGVKHAENIAMIMQKATEQERINGMLESAQSIDITEALA